MLWLQQDELGWIVSPLPDDPREFLTKLVPATSAASGGDQTTAGQPAMVLHADTKSPARYARGMPLERL